MTPQAKLIVYTVGGIIAIALALILAPFTIVGAGERSVVTNLGVVSRTLGPGFHGVVPFTESVHAFDVRTQNEQTEATAASKDLQTVRTVVAVNYNLNPELVGDLYSRIGTNYKSTIIDPAVQEVVKAVTARYTAEELITKRAIVTDEILVSLKASVADRAQGENIVVTAVSIIDFNFSESFNQAIEAKVTAEQNALAAKNKLEQVKYEAQQTIESAKAEAESIRIKAQAITQQGGAEYVRLKYAEKWNGVLPTTMVPGDAVPFINVK